MSKCVWQANLLILTCSTGQIKLWVPLKAQSKFALQENEKQGFSCRESVVMGALRCSWCGPTCNHPSSHASTDATVSALIVGGLCGNPSDIEARQLENRLTTHLGLVSRLIASKARAQHLEHRAQDYQEKPGSHWGKRRANTKGNVVIVPANTCWCFEFVAYLRLICSIIFAKESACLTKGYLRDICAFKRRN